MIFSVKKDNGIIPRVLTQVLDSCINGVTLSDPDIEDNPVIYANQVFEKLTGYSREEIVGRNCRFLQGNDKDQEGIKEIHKALKEHKEIEVTLRNYKKNGELFYNHLLIRPLFDDQGNVIYYMGLQYDITKQVMAEKEIEELTNQLNLTNK
ncbi:MAG: PAS domain-containing protein [Gammaproteobacteria bacterium]|nr:PAS domain-containing protein [Gammaproteobacteria bacterium]